MRSEQTIKDLELVAQVIKTNGWGRGSLQNYYGQVCLVGAINTAIMGDARVSTRANPLLVRRRVEVVSILCQTVPSSRLEPSIERLMHWNDSHAYNKADVLKMIQKAIEQVRPKVRPLQFLQAGTPAPESGLLVMVAEPRQPKPKPAIQSPGRPTIRPKREPVLEPMPEQEREKELAHV